MEISRDILLPVKLHQGGFVRNHRFNPVDVFQRVFGIGHPDNLAASGVRQLGGPAAAHGQNGVKLLHDADIIQPLKPWPAPAHVFQGPGHVLSRSAAL